MEQPRPDLEEIQHNQTEIAPVQENSLNGESALHLQESLGVMDYNDLRSQIMITGNMIQGNKNTAHESELVKRMTDLASLPGGVDIVKELYGRSDE